MDETGFQPPPTAYEVILAETRKIGFLGWCWPAVGALLRVMAASKPGGRMLEIGTGTGVGTCWLLDGMDTGARLTTVDFNSKLQEIARIHLGMDPRLTIRTEDAGVTIGSTPSRSLDLIFADGEAGKHSLLDEVLGLLRPGGIYICDDTKPHPLWPPEHAAKIPPLMEALAARQDFRRLYVDWSSGAVVMVKIAG
jgi:predicted O-methyltransferase YrrM